jgi:hypothetical protein
MIGKFNQKIMLALGCTFAPLLVVAQEVLSDEEFRQQMLLTQLEDPFGAAPMVGAIGLFAVIIAAMYFATQREKRRQDFLARFAEKEQAIPRELLPPQPSRSREMRRGVWLLSLGLGLGLVLYLSSEEWEVAAWCLILLFLAAASFVNAIFFYPNADSSRQGESAE